MPSASWTPVARPASSTTFATIESARIARFGGVAVRWAGRRRRSSRALRPASSSASDRRRWHSARCGRPRSGIPWRRTPRRAAAWISEGSSSGYRVIGIGPRSPCHGSPPNSASASRRRNAGRTSAKVQPGFPRAAQASKSAAAPRTANRVSHEVPPRSLPRRSLLLAPAPSGSDSNSQSGQGRQPPPVPPVGRGPAATVGACLEQDDRPIDRSGKPARDDAAGCATPDDRDVEHLAGHHRPAPPLSRPDAGIQGMTTPVSTTGAWSV